MVEDTKCAKKKTINKNTSKNKNRLHYLSFPWNFHGVSWKPIEVHGSSTDLQGTYIDVRGLPWRPTALTSMEIHGILWKRS